MPERASSEVFQDVIFRHFRRAAPLELHRGARRPIVIEIKDTFPAAKLHGRAASISLSQTGSGHPVGCLWRWMIKLPSAVVTSQLDASASTAWRAYVAGTVFHTGKVHVSYVAFWAVSALFWIVYCAHVASYAAPHDKSTLLRLLCWIRIDQLRPPMDGEHLRTH